MDDRDNRIRDRRPVDRQEPRFDGRSDGGSRGRHAAAPQDATPAPRRYDPAPDPYDDEPADAESRRAAPVGYDRPAPAAEPARAAAAYEPHDDGAERRRDLDTRTRVDQRNNLVLRGIQVVDYLFYLLYALLGIRFVLTLLGANEAAGFAQFINNVTQPFYGPFSGIVARPALNGGFLDFPLVIALLAYMILHFAVRGLLRLLMTNELNAVRR